MTTVTLQRGSFSEVYHKSTQPLWLRIILLSVLGYEALGCLAGGIMLTVAPDGRLMDMPVSLMRGAFPDFLIPGIILFALGILNTAAFFLVLRRQRHDWIMASLAMGGLLIWFWVEIAILLELHWLHAMWGLPVVAGALAATSLFPAEALRRTLLVCGIASSLLYVIINIIVPAQWPEYNPVTQTVSELSAVDAPTQKLWMVLCAPYTFLVIAFAIGVRQSAGENRRLKTVGSLLLAYGLLGTLWPFAPMHLRETLAAGGSTFSDTMHISLGVVTEIIYLAALILAAIALGKSFRIYSVITMVLLVVFAVLTFREAPNVAINGPTPLIGIWERVNIGIFLLWMVVLAVLLIRRGRSVLKDEARLFH